MPEQAITLLRKRRQELEALTPSRSNWSRVTEWHARTRPLLSKHFSSELSEFDKILQVRWVAFPRAIGPGIDNSRTDAAEDAGNQRVVENAHARFLALIDALIELNDIELETTRPTDEEPKIAMEMHVNGDKIRKLRTIKAMSQRDLASQSEVSSATISRLESGHKRVHPYTLRSIAQVLDVDVEQLLLSTAPDSDSDESTDSEMATPSLSVTVTPYFHKRELEPENDLVFVLMPFSESWSDYIWNEEIKPIVTGIPDHPLRCLRADDLFGHDVMIDIYESIAAASIVIADITGRNANVFYELGIAHTLGKDVILLSQGTEHIPFDLLRFRHCIYSNDGPGYKILRDYLSNALLSNLQQ